MNDTISPGRDSAIPTINPDNGTANIGIDTFL